MKIETLSIETLKATAFDMLCEIEQCQFNIKQINAELQKRSNAPKEEPKPETPA